MSESKDFVRPQVWYQALAKASIPANARTVASFMIWDEEIIYQSNKYMQEHTPGISEDTIGRGKKWLIDNGWLELVAKGSIFGRQGFSSQYRRAIPQDHSANQGCVPDQEHSANLGNTPQITGVITRNTPQIRGTNRDTTSNRAIEKKYSRPAPDGSVAHKKPDEGKTFGTGLAKFNIPPGIDAPRKSQVPVSPVPPRVPKRLTQKTKAMLDAEERELTIAESERYLADILAGK